MIISNRKEEVKPRNSTQAAADNSDGPYQASQDENRNPIEMKLQSYVAQDDKLNLGVVFHDNLMPFFTPTFGSILALFGSRTQEGEAGQGENIAAREAEEEEGEEEEEEEDAGVASRRGTKRKREPLSGQEIERVKQMCKSGGNEWHSKKRPFRVADLQEICEREHVSRPTQRLKKAYVDKLNQHFGQN